MPITCKEPKNFFANLEVYPINIGVLFEILLIFHKTKYMAALTKMADQNTPAAANG